MHKYIIYLLTDSIIIIVMYSHAAIHDQQWIVISIDIIAVVSCSTAVGEGQFLCFFYCAIIAVAKLELLYQE